MYPFDSSKERIYCSMLNFASAVSKWLFQSSIFTFRLNYMKNQRPFQSQRLSFGIIFHPLNYQCPFQSSNISGGFNLVPYPIYDIAILSDLISSDTTHEHRWMIIVERDMVRDMPERV